MRAHRMLLLAAAFVLVVLAPTGCAEESSDPAGPEPRATFSSGTITWRDGQHADLDTGGVGGGTGASDFFFGDEPNGISSTIWTATGEMDSGARLAYLGVVDYDTLSWEQVGALGMTDWVPFSRAAYRAGAVFAYRTDAGRLGKMRILAFDAAGFVITMQYLTWE